MLVDLDRLRALAKKQCTLQQWIALANQASARRRPSKAARNSKHRATLDPDQRRARITAMQRAVEATERALQAPILEAYRPRIEAMERALRAPELHRRWDRLQAMHRQAARYAP